MALTKEERYARKRAWYAANKDRVQAQQKEWRSTNADQRREYHKRRWVERRDQLQQRNKNWWAKNKESEKVRVKGFRKSNPDLFAAYHLRKRLGIPLDEAKLLVERRRLQGCEVCGSTEKCFVDHDHQTGKVRGILCRGCNTALGHAKEQPEVLIALADYLRRNA